MKKATLSGAFAELRSAARLSQLDIAKKCDISETTVWKIENGMSVRWETVHLVLTLSFNIQPGTDRYQSFQSLWVRYRQEMAEAQSPDFATKRMSKSAVAAVRKFRKLVHDLDAKRIQKVMAAAKRAAVKH